MNEGVHEMADGVTSLGVTALINIILTLICIVFSWWILTNIRLDAWMRETEGIQAKALPVFLSIVLGHGLATFLIDYMSWSKMLSQLF